ncbi:MAG TPA: RcpC/CpaB family pilus assembly protein [Streptosporangiaceae bacterium]
MTRRILTIVLAIVLAVIGTGAVLLYVKGADQRAIAGQKAVSVLVAAQQVPAGTTASAALSEGLLSRQKLPAASVPADAVRSITSQLTGLVLSADLPSGQLLLRPMLVTAVVARSGLPIPSGKVALSLQFCLARDVAGYVQAGSEVAVFNTFVTGTPGSATISCAGISAQKGVKVRLVLPKVQVLAVGPAPTSTASGTGATSTAFSQNSSSTQSSSTTIMLVTVAVNQFQAEQLIHLDENQVPYLALVTPSSGVKADVQFQP